MSTPSKSPKIKDQDEPIEIQLTEEAEPTESGKFRQLLGILKKAINVKDLAGLRISLPATLMEPIGNLEYWQYADRPDFFASITESEDDLERMLAVLRWTFTKDLKFVKHKIAKPFNSILGEHFKCHWEIQPSTISPIGTPVIHSHFDLDPSAEVLAAAGKPPSKIPSTNVSSTSLLPPTTETDSAATSIKEGKTRVVFLNEQTCHHPPISFFQIEARGPKGVVKAVGADQLSAKFTGTTVKVYPGPHNYGIFIALPEREEEYQVTHPTATIAGLLRGSPYVTIGESCFVTCRTKGKRNLRAIISYPDESWLLKPKFLCEGVIYDYGSEETVLEFTKSKQVPSAKVLATFSGNWRGEITYTLASSSTPITLIDLTPLAIVPKVVAPLEEQDELETQKVWNEVTQALLSKEWGNATKAKQVVEQAQRVKAEERKKKEEVFLPKYFLPEPIDLEEWDGRPILNPAGVEAIEKEFKAIYN